MRSFTTSAKRWAFNTTGPVPLKVRKVLELHLDEAVRDPGTERSQPQARGGEAFAGLKVVDLLVQRGGNGGTRPFGAEDAAGHDVGTGGGILMCHGEDFGRAGAEKRHLAACHQGGLAPGWFEVLHRADTVPTGMESSDV